jgi:hypothetical protein
MKHLTLVILLALAPLSWGEEELVFYCVEENRIVIEKAGDQQNYSATAYETEQFTFKYEPEMSRLVMKGGVFPPEDKYYLKCEVCNILPFFVAHGEAERFTMKNERFFLAVTTFVEGILVNGTCTKF